MPAPQPNYARMFALIDEVFAPRKNPDQIHVTPAQIKKMQKLHPSTLIELADENGPVIWVVVIPTTGNVMNDFLSGKISEKGILKNTKVGDSFDCLYLCSATTLPEYRGKGETKKLCLRAIYAIGKDYPIKTLFAWPFTNEGEALAESVARECRLELKKK